VAAPVVEPDTLPDASQSCEEIAVRIMRVMAADTDLAVAMLYGWCKPGLAEEIGPDPAPQISRDG
jgi:hypothetical protein